MIYETEAKYLDTVYLKNRLDNEVNIRNKKISYEIRRSKSSNSIYLRFWITKSKNIRTQIRISDHRVNFTDFLIERGKPLTVSKKQQFNAVIKHNINKLIRYEMIGG